MREANFYDNRGRGVTIKITNEAIFFYHTDDIERQEKWVSEQEANGYEVSEDEKKIYEFYWIEKSDWERDKKERQGQDNNWHEHMKRKTWFTNEMYDFINNQLTITGGEL